MNGVIVAKKGDGKGPDPIDKEVGRALKMRRIFLGISQEKLAEKLGITFQQVQKYEAGTNRIGASRLFAICRILGIQPNDMYQFVPENGFIPITREIPIYKSKVTHQAAQMFDGLTPKTKATVIRVMEALK